MTPVRTPRSLESALAEVIGDAWHGVCETSATWATSTPEQRATFAAMADCAVKAARAGPGGELAIAKALAWGFWRDDPAPPSWAAWDRLASGKREVFLTVARAVITAGRAMRAARAPAAARSLVEAA